MKIIKPTKYDHNVRLGKFILEAETGIDIEFLEILYRKNVLNCKNNKFNKMNKEFVDINKYHITKLIIWVDE